MQENCKNAKEEMLMSRAAPTLVFGIALLVGGLASARAATSELNDYPTSARVDYVFGCMKANGENQHSLEQCSCSIDIVASILPYEGYVTAETVLRMAQVPGNLGTQFRSTGQAATAVEDLLVLDGCAVEADWAAGVIYIPLR